MYLPTRRIKSGNILPEFNKGLAPSFNVARVVIANLPISGGLYLPLIGKMSPPP